MAADRLMMAPPVVRRSLWGHQWVRPHVCDYAETRPADRKNPITGTPVIRLRYRRPLTPRHAWIVDPRDFHRERSVQPALAGHPVEISDHGWAIASFGARSVVNR
jgi:hypothetical protein